MAFGTHYLNAAYIPAILSTFNYAFIKMASALPLTPSFTPFTK